jgi:ribosomal protein S18 acetylase RimI-like enzyme
MDQKMTQTSLRNFTPADIPAITKLQQTYQQASPHAPVIPGEVYLSPGFEDGKNIFCAYDEKGELLGYAPLLPVLTDDPGLPHTVWAEVKADPQAGSAREVKDGLFERLLGRTREISAAHPGRRVHLTFQYHPSETASMDYVVSRGCTYQESVFRMMRELAEPIPTVPSPDAIDIRRCRLDTEAEQRAYIRARNEAFPEAPVSPPELQAFLHSPAWREGTMVTAFEGEEVAGSLAAYWDETISQMSGRKAGYTEYIFVREKWRKRGIAAALIVQGLQYLKEHEREAAFLEVKAANENALKLYQRLGYRVIDETRLFVLKIQP